MLLGFTSCSDDDASGSGSGYEFGPKVYVSTGLFPADRASVKLVKTPLTTELRSEVTFPVRLTTPVSSDLEVSFAIDNNLVATFNDANKTDYAVLPEGCVVDHTQSVVIVAQKVISESQVSVTNITLPNEIEEKKYLIPIKIAGVNSKSASISANLSTFYVIASVSKTNVDVSVTDLTGDVYTKSGWSATASSQKEDKYSVEKAIDGDNTTAWVTASGTANTTNALLTVDMGKSQAMNAIRITPNFAYTGTTYAVKLIEVYTSTDGINWEKQGVSAEFNKTIGTANAPVYKWIKFYAPVTARYLQFKFIQNWSGSYVGVGEVDVVK